MRLISSKLLTFVRKLSFRFILKSVFRLLIIVLCCYQINSIANEYINNKPLSNVEFELPNEIVLPSVNLCFQFRFAINRTTVKAEWPQFNNIVAERLRTQNDYIARRPALQKIYGFLGNKTIAQLVKYIKNMDSFIAEASPTQINTTDKLHCKWTRYLRLPRICLKISCYRADGSAIRYPKSLNEDPNLKGRMLYIGLDSSASKITGSLLVIFTKHERIARVCDDLAYQVHLDRSVPKTYYLTYKLIETNLTKAKYQTNCRSYSSNGGLTRSEVLQNCLNTLCKARIGSYFFSSPVSLDKPQVDLKTGYHQYYREFLQPNITQMTLDRQFFSDIRRFCNQLYIQPECEKENYEPTGSEVSQRFKHNYSIIVQIPITPFIKNIYFPSLTSFDYFIYVTSVFSSWFGVSVILLINKVLNKVFKQVRR